MCDMKEILIVIGILAVAMLLLSCDMLARVVIAPYELPIELVIGVIGSLLFVGLLFYRLKHGRKALRFKSKIKSCGSCCQTVTNLGEN